MRRTKFLMMWLSISLSLCLAVLACGTVSEVSTTTTVSEEAMTTLSDTAPEPVIRETIDLTEGDEIQLVAKRRSKARRAPRSRFSGTPTLAQADALAECETTDEHDGVPGDEDANTGNGYYGAFQFLPSTWRAVRGNMVHIEAGREVSYPLPHLAPYDWQRHVVQRIPLEAWPRQFPGCSRKLGITRR